MNSDKRKQLKNNYKNKAAVGGVYAIECSGNHRRCIKSTVDIAGIKNRFQFALSIKGCPDPIMNNEWIQYGSDAFSLVILEELTMKDGQTPKEFANDIALLYEMWLEKTAAEES